MLRRRTSVLLYIMITLTITAAVIWGVMANNAHHSDSIDPLTLSFLLATLLFGGISFAIYKTRMIQVSINNDGGPLTVFVADKTLTEPLYLQEPFIITRRWCVDFERRGIQTKRLYLTIFDNLQQPLLTFTGGLSAIQKQPPEFEPLGEEDKLIIAADRCYETWKVLQINEALNNW